MTYTEWLSCPRNLFHCPSWTQPRKHDVSWGPYQKQNLFCRKHCDQSIPVKGYNLNHDGSNSDASSDGLHFIVSINNGLNPQKHTCTAWGILEHTEEMISCLTEKSGLKHKELKQMCKEAHGNIPGCWMPLNHCRQAEHRGHYSVGIYKLNAIGRVWHQGVRGLLSPHIFGLPFICLC